MSAPNADRHAVDLPASAKNEMDVTIGNYLKRLGESYLPTMTLILPLQHGLRSMQPEATHHWAKGAGGRVAIIHTGMELTHQDLATNIEMSKNFVDKDEVVFSSDIMVSL